MQIPGVHGGGLQGILGIEEHYFTEKLAITKTNAKNRK
jgi:hypothetical protein